jgi:hypothetical protein
VNAPVSRSLPPLATGRRVQPVRKIYWGLLQNPAYIGQAAFGKTQEVPRQGKLLRPLRAKRPQPRRATCRREVDPQRWIRIPVPALVEESLFAALAEQLAENRQHAREGQRGAPYLKAWPAASSAVMPITAKRLARPPAKAILETVPIVAASEVMPIGVRRQAGVLQLTGAYRPAGTNGVATGLCFIARSVAPRARISAPSPSAPAARKPCPVRSTSGKTTARALPLD